MATIFSLPHMKEESDRSAIRRDLDNRAKGIDPDAQRAAAERLGKQLRKAHDNG